MSLDPDDLIPDDPPPPPPHRPAGPAMITWVLAGLLAASTVGNIALLRRGAHVEPPQSTRVVPATTPCPVCPPAPECPSCEPLPPPPPPCPCLGDGGAPPPRHTGPGPGPRVDEAMAQEGEGHIATATNTGERDPAHLGAQRSVITGVDRIADSHSSAAAERFLSRNLPAIASMDCAFRDPALAEHVRMRLREMNRLARPQFRLTEEQLTRYERDLRCPRE